MNSFDIQLPEVALHLLMRSKLQAWLEFHAGVALRYVAAPAGAGKTTLAVTYARSRSHPVGYVSLSAHSTTGDVLATLAQIPDSEDRARIASNALSAQTPDARAGIASNAASARTDYADVLAGLARLPRVEIVIDDLDNASPSVRGLLARLYHDVADTVTFIYLARSSDAIAGEEFEAARGFVARCDPGLFAFDNREIGLFAKALGLNEDPVSVVRLQRDTLGWAYAVAGVCLTAVATASCVRDSFPVWRRLTRRSLDEIVAGASRCAPPEVGAEFLRVVAGQQICDQRSLAIFAAYGLFVGRVDGRLRLNPVIVAAPHDGEPVARDADNTGAATLEMFGRFAYAIDGKRLVWQRRRDRQIIQYLALQPDGRATRAQLISLFWPDTDRQLAGQSLRTACSTIRSVIAARVGAANVGRYFSADRFVELKLDATVNSVTRFQMHVAYADRAYERGDAHSAYNEYLAAEKLYIAPLLAGEPPTDWIASHAARLASMQRRGNERLQTIVGSYTSDNAGQIRSLLGIELSA